MGKVLRKVISAEKNAKAGGAGISVNLLFCEVVNCDFAIGLKCFFGVEGSNGDALSGSPNYTFLLGDDHTLDGFAAYLIGLFMGGIPAVGF